MKKWEIFVAALSMLAVFCAILADFSGKHSQPMEENRTYDSSYEAGLSIGKDIGYEEGHSDGYATIRFSRSDAEHYACSNSLYHPEEAMMIIDAFENNEPFWSNGEAPSQQDYMDAVRSLYYFYEYFYNGDFSNYRDP